ncbi:hypothetical protein Ahia01_000684400 [Argonauta hians]
MTEDKETGVTSAGTSSGTKKAEKKEIVLSSTFVAETTPSESTESKTVKDCECSQVTANTSTVNDPTSEQKELDFYKKKEWYQKFVIVLDSDDDEDSDENEELGLIYSSNPLFAPKENGVYCREECSDSDSGYNECDDDSTNVALSAEPIVQISSAIDAKELEALEELFKNTDWMGSGLKPSSTEE